MNASKDDNFINTKTAVLESDGKTIVKIAVNPITHALRISDGTTGIDLGPNNAIHDDNGVPTMIGVSSADFSTPVIAYADANNKLLINLH
jgi:hypothetical protein